MLKTKRLHIDKKYFYFLLGLCMCFCLLSSVYTLHSILKEIRQDINYQSLILKKEIISALDTAKHVLRGIASSITPYDNSKYNTIKIFDLKDYSHNKLQFSAIVITDSNHHSIASSVLDPDKFFPKNFTKAKCLNHTKTQPNVVHIEEPSYGI